MTATSAQWSSLRLRCPQQGRRAFAFEPSRCHCMFLGFTLLFLSEICSADSTIIARQHRVGAVPNTLALETSGQRLCRENCAGDLQDEQQQLHLSGVSALLPRFLTSNSQADASALGNGAGAGAVSKPQDLDAADDGAVPLQAGSLPVYGGGNGTGNGTTTADATDSAGGPASPPLGDNSTSNGTTNSTQALPSPSPPPPPPRPQLRSRSCSYDRVTAPDAGGGCGPHQVVVLFAALPPDDVSDPWVMGTNATLMCGNPAAYSPETGTLNISVCWRPGDLPDRLLASAAASTGAAAAASATPADGAAAVNGSATDAGGSAVSTIRMHVTLPRLQLYGISSMAAGNYSLEVDGADAFGVVVHPADASAAAGAAASELLMMAANVSSPEAGPGDAAGGADAATNATVPSAPSLIVSIPVGGAAAVTVWFHLLADITPELVNATADAITDITANGTTPVVGGDASGSGNSSSSSSSNSTTNGSSSNDRVNSTNMDIGNSTSSRGGLSGDGAGAGGGSSNGFGWGRWADGLWVTRTLSLSMLGSINPPPTASTCRCALVAVATTTNSNSNNNNSYTTAGCPAGMVPLVAAVPPAAAQALPPSNSTVSNGANGINSTANGFDRYAADVTSGAAASAGDDGGIDEDAADVPAPFVQCVSQPVYDKTSRRLAFSTCWRYACLPAAFARRPYELLLGPVSYASAASAPPAGNYRLSGSLPDGVSLSYEYTTAVNSNNWTAVGMGGNRSGSSLVTLPYLGSGQVRIRIQIPFDMSVDNNGGSLELKLMPSSGSSSGTGSSSNGVKAGGGISGSGSGSSSTSGGGSSTGGGTGSSVGVTLEAPDGTATPLPPLPAAAAASNATLVAVSELWLPRRVTGGPAGTGAASVATSELAEMVRKRMEAEAVASGGEQAAPANITVTVAVTGFRLTMPLQFRDFSLVADCSDGSLATLRTNADAALAAAAAAGSSYGTAPSPVTLLSVGCSYGGYTRSRRRRLQQQTCTPRLNTPLAVDTPALDLDAFLSSSTASLLSTYGESMCNLDPISSDIQVTSKLAVSVTMPAARVITTSSPSTTTGGSGTTDSASAVACTAGAQALASAMGLSDGEAMVVGCQLSAEAPPNAVPPHSGIGTGTGTGTGSSSSPAPSGGVAGGAANGGGTAGNGGGGGAGVPPDGSTGGSGDGKKGVKPVIIIIAAGAGAAALAALVLAAVVVRWRRRRRSRSARFLSSEASTGQRTFDSISSVSISDTAKALAAARSDDSVRCSTSAAAPLVDGKRRRQGTDGPDSTALRTASAGFNESSGMGPCSSKSLESYRARACSSMCRTTPRQSGYGGESGTGLCGGVRDGIEAGFLSVVPAPGAVAGGDPVVAGAAADTSRPSRRRSTYGSGDGSAGADPVVRRGAFHWPRVSNPGCTNDINDEGGGGDGGGEELYGSGGNAVPGVSRGSTTRGSRMTGGSRVSNSGATAGGGWYDFFGFDDRAAEAELVAGVMSEAPPGSSGGSGSGSGSGLAARRSSDSGGRRYGGHVLRRSNGGSLPLGTPPSPPSRDGDDGGGDGGGATAAAAGQSPRASRPSASASTSADPLARYLAPPGSATAASMVAASPPPLPPRSPRPIRQAPHFSCALPGAESYGIPENQPYDDESFGRFRAPGTAPRALLEGDDWDLLRVQSRRPAFLDRTGGSLAAAVAANVAVPYSSVGAGVGDASMARPGFTPRSAAECVEPRRPGFIRRNSVAPYCNISPSYASCIRSQHRTGSVTSAAGSGGPGPLCRGSLEAWSSAPSQPNSPGGQSGETLANALAGVIAGRRRSSGADSSANAIGRPSGSGAGGGGGSALSGSAGPPGEPSAVQQQQYGLRTPSLPTTPPPSPAASAPQWMGGLSRRARSRRSRRSADGGAAPAAAAASGAGGQTGGGVPAACGAAAAAVAEDVDAVASKYRVRQPPRVQVSGALDSDQEQDPGAVYGTGGRTGCRTAPGEIGTQAAAAAGLLPPADLPLSPRRLPQLLQPTAEASQAVADETLGSVPPMQSSQPPVSISRFAGAACRTAPAEPFDDLDDSSLPYLHDSPSGSMSGGGDGGCGSGCRPRVEELSPAFAPTAAMRARQLIKRSSSCGSSNGAVPYGMGGLVDPEVEATVESGAARLAMMKRLAVGPPRPAWGLVHAGVAPFKRSIASVQYIKSLTRGGSTTGTPMTSPAAAATAAAAISAATATVGTPGSRGSVPGRLLSGSGSTAADVSRASSEASGPFLRLLADP